VPVIYVSTVTSGSKLWVKFMLQTPMVPVYTSCEQHTRRQHSHGRGQCGRERGQSGRNADSRPCEIRGKNSSCNLLVQDVGDVDVRMNVDNVQHFMQHVTHTTYWDTL